MTVVARAGRGGSPGATGVGGMTLLYCTICNCVKHEL